MAADDLKPRRVGLILSGGGARGFAHIGVIRVLERLGVKVDVIAGSSMGAIIGAFYANGYSADDCYEIARKTSWRDVFDLSLQAGLIKGEKLHTLLAEYLPARFEELKLPLAVATTDIETGEQVFLLDGDLITAIRASSCFPGAFEPVKHLGRTLADGGIVNNLPVDAVSFLNANFTIASDVTSPRRAEFKDKEQGTWWERMLATIKLERRNPMAQMLLRSTDIMQSILTDIKYSLHPADVRVRCLMPHILVESFWDLDEIVALGEETAEATFKAANLTAQLGRTAVKTITSRPELDAIPHPKRSKRQG